MPGCVTDDKDAILNYTGQSTHATECLFTRHTCTLMLSWTAAICTVVPDHIPRGSEVTTFLSQTSDDVYRSLQCGHSEQRPLSLVGTITFAVLH